jgi:hypothetical protein
MRKEKLMAKRKLQKSIIAVVMAAVFCAVPTISASADAGNVTVSGNGATTLKDTGLYDANINGTLENNDYEIDVKALTSGGAEIVYNIYIEWGKMEFEYDFGSTWDPETHSYIMGKSGSQSGGWIKAGHVDGTQNKITVNNNSNFPVSVSFDFTEGNALNANKNAPGAVVGVFAANNNAFTDDILNAGKGGAGILAMETAFINLEMVATNLTAGTVYYATPNAASSTAETSTGAMYFALSGKPDKGAATTLTSVGTLKVKVEPYPGATQKTK